MTRESDEAREKAQQIGDEAKSRMGDLSSAAKDHLDEGREQAGRVATAVKDRAPEMNEKAADQVSQAGGYVQDHKPPEMARDLTRYLKSHPIVAGIATVVALFIVSKVLR